MATHPSAEKRNRQAIRRNLRNRLIKNELKTGIKALIAASKADAANLFKSFQSKLDKAKRKNIIKANAAAHKLAQMQRLVLAK